MKEQIKIFKDELLNAYLKKFSETQIIDFEEKWKIVKNWKRSCEIGDLKKTKETSVQGLFFSQIFNQVLGYRTIIDGGIYNQSPEFKSTLDGSEADGALGFFNVAQNLRDVRVAIELKGAAISLDKKQQRASHLTPVEQGMSYANKNGGKCGWVIVSNFIETRLYKSDSSLEYESFDIKKMDNKAEFLKFYFLLCKENLIEADSKSLVDKLYQENEEIGVKISNEFYKEYKDIRTNLYKHLKEMNTEKEELLLFTKSQKIMDRFAFICFCEDCGLLPSNLYKQLVESSEHSFSFSQTKLWDELRGLFKAIDIGNPPMKINRYNGGLFKEDPELDSLIIGDEPLKAFIRLSNYNFSSDLNVNILGQIFEQSVSDVEQIKNEINGVKADTKGKQKDDGIFYTPYYVTRYIVEQTVGVYLSNAKEEIKHGLFKNGNFKTEVTKKDTGRKNKIELSHWEELPVLKENPTIEEKMHYDAVCNLHSEYWNEYETILKNIKICDPSCGSGAFLNQCFDYLHEEMEFLLDMKRQFDEQISLFDIDKEILQNNLYGVDINPESVEITKLSLWLKTAKRNQTLATLDGNIKCGNSIIDSKEAAGKLAFDWKKEFPDIFSNGGFDIIVGNPPYGATLSDIEKQFIFKKYSSTQGGVDTYKTFYELGFELLKENGYIGFITPNTFLMQEMSSSLRKLLFENYTFCNLVELYNVFPNAVVEPVITVFKKNKPQISDKLHIILVPRKTHLSSTFVSEGISSEMPLDNIKANNSYVVHYKMSNTSAQLLEKLYCNSKEIGDYFHTATGIELYGIGKGTPPQTQETLDTKPFTCFSIEDDTCLPLARGTDINKYATVWHKEYVKYGLWLRIPKKRELFEREKLLIRRTGDYPLACYDDSNLIPERACHALYKIDENCVIDIKYILALLNSTLMRWTFRENNAQLVGKPLAQVNAKYIGRLPLKVENEKNVVTIVEDLILLYARKINKIDLFMHFLKATYCLEKPTERIKEFYVLTYNEFLNELKKRHVDLAASEKQSLLTLYEDNQNEVKMIIKQISQKEEVLDNMIYQIYGLNEVEIQYIKENA